MTAAKRSCAVANDRIAVIMGGSSAEREISRETGAGVLAALLRLGHAAYSMEFDRKCIATLSRERPVAVFNALHGGAGEDGTLQALLDWLDIPYQGSGVRASAAAMDKWLTKALLRAEGLPAPRGALLHVARGVDVTPPPEIGFPCVLKPVAQGSAVAVHIVHELRDWPAAVRAAAAHDTRLLVEEYIRGREFTVAVLESEALPVVEITPHGEFYSYDAKYTKGGSTHTVPAQLDTSVARRMQDCALRLHRALGCRDYSRVDVMLDESETLYTLECNTLPGLTSLSLFPDAARAAGIGYDALVDRLVRLALGRSEHRRPTSSAGR